MLDSVSLSMGGLAGIEDKTTDASKGLTQTYDQFLTLLTVQLKNQDPLNPMDSKDFTSQLVNMANAEQSIAQTKKLDELIKLTQASTINSSLLSYIGMQVEYEGKDFTYAGGQSIQFEYKLEGEAATNEINIYNDKDELVWTGAGEKTEGDHTIVWPGVDKDGKRVNSGAYRIEVKARDAENAVVASSTPVENFNYSGKSAEMPLKYKLEAEAKETKVSVFDAAGKLVWSADGQRSAGEHEIVWPGVDKDGKPVSAGYYTIEVGAKDSENRAVKTSTKVPAVVHGVETVDGSIKLLIGDQKVSIDSVTSVSLG